MQFNYQRVCGYQLIQLGPSHIYVFTSHIKFRNEWIFTDQIQNIVQFPQIWKPIHNVYKIISQCNGRKMNYFNLSNGFWNMLFENFHLFRKSILVRVSAQYWWMYRPTWSIFRLGRPRCLQLNEKFSLRNNAKISTRASNHRPRYN